MENLSKLDKQLLNQVGKKEYSILKTLSTEDKESIIQSFPTIEVANTMNQCVWIGNKAHTTIYVNPAYASLTGYSLEWIISSKAKSNFCFTKESKKTIERHHLLRKKGRSSQYEGDILSKNNKTIQVLVHGAPLKKGGTIGLFSNLSIMDKLNRENQELLEILGQEEYDVIKKQTKKEDQRTLLQVANTLQIANAMNQCFWLGDKNHKTIYANKIYQDLTEYSLEECIGQDSDFCFTEESKRAIAEQHKLRKKGVSSQYEGTYQSKSGKEVPVLVIGSPTETGGTCGMHVNMSEIRELSASKKITDQIIRNSFEAVVILNKGQRIKLWNNGASKVFGYKEDEVLNKKINIIIPAWKKEENENLINQVNEKKFLRNIETKMLTKAGDEIDVNISITKVTDEKGKFIGYLLIYRDISLEKKTNIELQKRFEAIQDAYKELGIQKRQIDYLYEISSAAASNCSLSSLANLIVSAICLLTKCDGTTLRLYEPQKAILKLEACIGVSQKWLTKNQFSFKTSLAEDAVKTGRPLLVDNIQSSQKHKGVKLLKSHKFTTLILIPLLLPNKIVGTISLYSSDASKFRFIETDFLENFGKQCALALYVKQLTESAKSST